MVGPGKTFDTDRYFVICSNTLGGCMGTSGPKEINQETGRPWGLDFPVITIRDMVKAQAMLLDHLGIEQLFCVSGGSMGGMQALQWVASYPERCFTAVPIACAAKHSAQNIALNEVGRQAIMADPEWREGRYQELGTNPVGGLAVARMAAHISPISRNRRCTGSSAGRCRTGPTSPTASMRTSRWRATSAIRGRAFVERFDANSYLYITRAIDYFDLAADYDGVLANAFRGVDTRFCVISFTSDWLYPTSENRAIVRALAAAAANVSFVEVVSDKGHDAFLLDEPDMFETLRGFLSGAAAKRGLSSP